MKSGKVTKVDQAANAPIHGRWYGDTCGAAYALEVVGERWSLLVIRELIFGGRRFSDLRRVLGGISARVLTERLEWLEQAGVLRRCMAGPPVSAQIYELTDWGLALKPTLVGLCNWGVRSPGHNPALGLTPSAWIMAMEAMFQPRAARGVQAVLGFEAGGESFLVTIDDGEITNQRGDCTTADIWFRADTTRAFLRLFFGKAPLAVVERELGLTIGGDRELAEQLISLFRVPRGEFASG